MQLDAIWDKSVKLLKPIKTAGSLVPNVQSTEEEQHGAQKSAKEGQRSRKDAEISKHRDLLDHHTRQQQ